MKSQASADKKVIFYVGTNGSGKSTLRDIHDNDPKIKIDPDAEARRINPNNPRSVDLAAGKKALQLFREAVEYDLSFSMESTLTGKTILKRMQQASDNGYFVELRYVGLSSADLNVARVKRRALSGGHDIDEDVVRRRYQDSRENLSRAIHISHLTVIWDNSTDKAFECATISNGKVEYVSGIEIPDWVAVVVKDYERSRVSEMPGLLKVIEMSKTPGLENRLPDESLFKGSRQFNTDDDLEP